MNTLTAEQNELLDLRDKVAEQVEEIRQLRAALYGGGIVFPAEWALTKQEHELLACLYACRSGYRTKEQLFTASRNLDADIDIKIVDVIVCKLRQKLKRFDVSIETKWGRGYALPNAARELITQAIGRPFAPGSAAELIAAIMIAFASGKFSTDEIAGYLRVSESFVVRAIDAWKGQTREESGP